MLMVGRASGVDWHSLMRSDPAFQGTRRPARSRFRVMVSSWTDRHRLQRQYVDPGNLATRVGVYQFLIPDQEMGSQTFEEWILDHLRWTGTEAVLDVGRGSGTYESALRHRAGRTVGLDLSEGMLVRWASTRPSPLIVGDAQHLPVGDGTFDIGLAAHMLYHVPDIDRALRELRRALRPDGTALLVANGSEDKHEIRALWQEAAFAVAGSSFSLPAWTRRFSIDESLEVVERIFPDIRVDALTGQFRFPTPDPVIAWVDSLRAGTENEISTETWDAVTTDLRSRIEERIDRIGEFTARKASGVIIAR
jgi:ubiquinone/menaquinone biosynthesis C-methylase UbiE